MKKIVFLPFQLLIVCGIQAQAPQQAPDYSATCRDYKITIVTPSPAVNFKAIIIVPPKIDPLINAPAKENLQCFSVKKRFTFRPQGTTLGSLPFEQKSSWKPNTTAKNMPQGLSTNWGNTIPPCGSQALSPRLGFPLR
jgi:hypothetical protein